MKTPDYHRRQQKSVVFVALMLFELLLFFIQIWLFVMVLENTLGGKTAMAIPAALASLGILGINIWMLRGVEHLKRQL
ncbi:MAG: hypothetical protein K8R88_10880 [Armatimonadetes bacterium]|nr:hypothetical protein [Armatimonadota bacterium]